MLHLNPSMLYTFNDYLDEKIVTNDVCNVTITDCMQGYFVLLYVLMLACDTLSISADSDANSYCAWIGSAAVDQCLLQLYEYHMIIANESCC